MLILSRLVSRPVTWLVAISWVLAGAANAADYTIQIGAFSKPSTAFVKSARETGRVSSTTTKSGITIFTVGRYSSMNEARNALQSLSSNYPDAFVRNMPGNAMPTEAAASSQKAAAAPNKAAKAPNKAAAAPNKAATAPNKAATAPAATTRRLKPAQGSQQDSDLWNSLSDDERKRVVYLDGVLHLKEGEQFVPLAEHRRR